MSGRDVQEPLLHDREGRPIGPGPVYQGVAKSIRALIRDGKLDRELDAGRIASTRQLARSIDRASGHGGYRVEYGQALATLHQQLMAQLQDLGGQPADADPFNKLLEELGAPREAPAT